MINKECPKISVILPVYNAVETVEQTIYSIVNQIYSNIEFIIIDGSSNDGTIEILEKYKSKIDIMVSEEDNGIYDAMNKGIDLATGEWIYIIGSDDFLYNQETFSVVAKYFDSAVDIISGVVWSVDEKTLIQYYNSNNYPHGKEVDLLNNDVRAHHQGLFIRSCLMKLLKFDTIYKVGADFRLLLQLWLNPNYKLLKVDIPIAFFSTAGKGSKDINLRKLEHEKVVKEFEGVLKQNNVDINKLLGRNNETFIKNKIKTWIKGILLKCDLKTLIIKYQWKDGRNTKKIHSCSWSNCRWCKRK